MILKRVGILSCAKVVGILYGLLGVIMGLFFALFCLLGAFAGSFSPGFHAPAAGVIMGIVSVIFFPLLYGAMGFVFALITAALYNWIAGAIGGIEVELE